jgi:hypothetical protein
MKSKNPKRHHFVPQLYMRNFCSDSKRKFITLYVIKKQLALGNKSIRDQCYAGKLYGVTSEVEDMLQRFESPLSVVLRRLAATSRLPDSSSDDMSKLYGFVALQMIRTAHEAARLSEALESMSGKIGSYMLKGAARAPLKRPLSEYSLTSLRAWPKVLGFTQDLAVRLIINKTGRNLITSDNPVIKYNQYCEGMQGITTTGLLAQGLQIFLPVSKKHLILFYDDKAYAVAKHGNPVVDTEDLRDIATFNLLQAINAGQILLFSEWADLRSVQESAKGAIRYRTCGQPQIEELVDDNAPNRRTLLHLYWTNVNIGMNLSFLSVRRRAKRITQEFRVNRYREQSEHGAYINSRRDDPRGVFRRFRSRKMGK